MTGQDVRMTEIEPIQVVENPRTEAFVGMNGCRQKMTSELT